MFGCVAYMKVARPHLIKLDPRGLKVVFIGYEPGNKVYGLYDPTEGRDHVSCDIIFDKSTFSQWNNVIEADQNPNKFMVEYLDQAGRRRSAASGTVTAVSSCTP